MEKAINIGTTIILIGFIMLLILYPLMLIWNWVKYIIVADLIILTIGLIMVCVGGIVYIWTDE